jgi:hypothetical protein
MPASPCHCAPTACLLLHHPPAACNRITVLERQTHVKSLPVSFGWRKRQLGWVFWWLGACRVADVGCSNARRIVCCVFCPCCCESRVDECVCVWACSLFLCVAAAPLPTISTSSAPVAVSWGLSCLASSQRIQSMSCQAKHSTLYNPTTEAHLHLTCTTPAPIPTLARTLCQWFTSCATLLPCRDRRPSSALIGRTSRGSTPPWLPT